MRLVSQFALYYYYGLDAKRESAFTAHSASPINIQERKKGQTHNHRILEVINLTYDLEGLLLFFSTLYTILCKHFQKIFQRISDNSQCSTQRSDLIIIQSVWNDIKKLRQTKSKRTVATSPRCFNKPTCKATVLLKCRHL